jgi:adenine-specific DNA-methyltransferase
LRPMNWKHFIAECQELKAWLAGQGWQDSERGLITILALVLRGGLSPETTVGLAADRLPLPAALTATPMPGQDRELPDNIHAIIGRWQHNLPSDIWLLGEIYEKMALGRRTQGLFYTDPAIIDFILAQTVAKADLLANPFLKILDPACGCGNFLLKTYDFLKQRFSAGRSELAARFPALDWSDAGIHRHIITHNLWGADIDSLAAEIATAGLLLKQAAASDNPAANILICDSLRRPSPGTADNHRAFWSASYDFVIGNPPYLSFGLRGTSRLDPDYEAYLRQSFSASAEYKLSYYVLFLERGIEMLAAGGRLGFILPDSFLLGRYYSKIRRYIMDHTAIEHIAHIALPVFKGAAVGMSAICILRREDEPAARSGQVVAVQQVLAKDDLKEPATACRYSQDYFAGLPYNRFRLFSDLTVKNLIDKIDNNSEPLVKFASGHSGIRSRTRQIDIVGTAAAGPTWRRGLISGAQVQRYGLTYGGHWLNIDPALLYKGGWDPAIIERRKILLRQTGYTLTACIDDNGYYHLNNIHSFIATGETVSPDYLLLILNSRLLSFYYHAVSGEYGRSMAQTDIDTLELLPVRVSPEVNQSAPELVKIMTNLTDRRLAGDPQADGRFGALDDLCNQIVYRIYELSDSEIACIEKYETRLAARRRSRARASRGR